MVSRPAKAVVDAAGERDRRGMDGALHPCGDIGAYRMESFFAGSGGCCHAFYCERRGECFLELCVLLLAPAGAGHLGVPRARSYDRALGMAHRADLSCCLVAACAICGVGDVRVVPELPCVGDEPVGDLIYF